MEAVRTHDVVLKGDRLVLRSLTEEDWDVLYKWNNDPDVLYFSEGDGVSGYSLGEVKQLYRAVSQHAFCFIMEYQGKPIGECWLQEMNLERILDEFPGLDCRRIDLMIGEKVLWGYGLGTEAIALLVQFGFESEQADVIFACDIADYNKRSLRAFKKLGFAEWGSMRKPPGEKAKRCYDLILSKSKSIR